MAGPNIAGTMLCWRSYCHTANWGFDFPEPREDPKNGSTLGLYHLHHRSIRVQNRGFSFLDPPWALGLRSLDYEGSYSFGSIVVPPLCFFYKLPNGVTGPPLLVRSQQRAQGQNTAAMLPTSTTTSYDKLLLLLAVTTNNYYSHDPGVEPRCDLSRQAHAGLQRSVAPEPLLLETAR